MPCPSNLSVLLRAALFVAYWLWIPLADAQSTDPQPTRPSPSVVTLLQDVSNRAYRQEAGKKACSAHCGDGLCTPNAGAKLGTGLTWQARVSDAASRAAEESKLLFLIHVSGNFAKEDFT